MKIDYCGLERKIDKLMKLELSDRMQEFWKLDKSFAKFSSSDFVKKVIAYITDLKIALTEKYAVDLKSLDVLTSQIGETIIDYCQTKQERLSNKIETYCTNFMNNGHLTPVEEKGRFRNYKNGKLYCAIARKNEKFIVSKGFLDDFLFYFDFWLNVPEDREWITNEYAKKIRQIEKESGENISHFCFVKKQFGCDGPIRLFWDIGSRFIDKKCFVYQQKHLSKEDMFLGDTPNRKSTLCVLYDLRKTGEGIYETIVNIEKEYKCKVSGIVIIYDFAADESNGNLLVKTVLPNSILSDDFRKFQKTLKGKFKQSHRFENRLNKIQELDEAWSRKADFSDYTGEWVAIYNRKIVAHNPESDIAKKIAVRQLAVPAEAILLNYVETPGTEYL